jgi:ferric-dicitrate binding protein FerR (iron transport regulator)
MERLDNLRARLDGIEQQTEAFTCQTRTAERRARWWRGIACGMLMLGLLSWALPSGKAAARGPGANLEQRVTTLEDKLVAVTFDAATKVLAITGANGAVP